MALKSIKVPAIQRSELWRQIWEKKYKLAEGAVHQLDGFDLLTDKQWTELTARFCQLMEPLVGADVMEVGCGAGAFLEQIAGARSLSGVDYSESAITAAKSRLDGNFFCADAKSLPFPDAWFDIVFSFGVFFYFDSLAYAESVVREMFRVARPGARVFIFELNDRDRIERYNAIRSQDARREQVKKTDARTTHLFFHKPWCHRLGQALGAKVHIEDEADLNVSFHSGAEYRFLVRYDIPP
jgi:ubiquinone/menaquinone biosynthesis C-methylase UbiE